MSMKHRVYRGATVGQVLVSVSKRESHVSAVVAILFSTFLWVEAAQSRGVVVDTNLSAYVGCPVPGLNPSACSIGASPFNIFGFYAANSSTIPNGRLLGGTPFAGQFLSTYRDGLGEETTSSKTPYAIGFVQDLTAESDWFSNANMVALICLNECVKQPNGAITQIIGYRAVVQNGFSREGRSFRARAELDIFNEGSGPVVSIRSYTNNIPNAYVGFSKGGLVYRPRPGVTNLAGVSDVFTSRLFSVPEPATWAMMIGGFGMLGAAARRRIRTQISYT